MKKKTLINTLIIVGCTLLCIFVLCMIGRVSNGTFDIFNTDEWELRSVNEDNLIKVDSYDVKDLNTGLGYTIDVTDDGQIKVSGENETEEAQQIKVQELTLAKGTYTFTSGVKGTSKAGYNMAIVIGEKTYYADFGTDSTFTLDAEATATVYINIGAKTECNVTFSPVLVEGEEAGDFFVINK